MAIPAFPGYDEITESITQWVAAYRSFFNNPSRGGETFDVPGVFVAVAGTLLPLCNGAVFTEKINDEADIEQRISTVQRVFAERGLNGIFSVCDALVPPALRDAVPNTFARFGYVPATGMTGMAADGLLPPTRELLELRYERLVDVSSAQILARLNVIAYDMPLDWAADWEAHIGISETGGFCFIGYVGAQPVTCAATYNLENRLYVAMVATDPAYRGRGCAEAVMRHSLEAAKVQTGLTRSILHASDMGHALYLQMGYHDTVHFTMYGMKEAETSGS